MTEFDAILRKWTDPETGHTHGASFVAYDRTGKCIYAGAQGSRTVDRSTNIPATVSDLCRLASQTKLITSVALMQLVEQGVVGLDDDCGKIDSRLSSRDILVGFEGDESETGKKYNARKMIYEFEKPRKAIFKKQTKPITLRLLLSHTSGFQYDFLSEELQEHLAYTGEQPNKYADMRKYDLPLRFEPGDSWFYGSGIDWAGQVLEKLTGQNLDQYVQEQICKPLGMRHTTFFPDDRLDNLPPQMELGFKPDGPKGKIVLGNPNFTPRPSIDALGGGGLYSTAEDYGLFLRALLMGGAPLLKRETVERLRKGVVSNRKDLTELGQGQYRFFAASDLLPDTEIDHGLGGMINETPLPGRRAAGSIKWSGLTNPYWWLDLDSGVAGTMMTQLLPAADPTANDLFVALEEQVYKTIGRASL